MKQAMERNFLGSAVSNKLYHIRYADPNIFIHKNGLKWKFQ